MELTAMSDFEIKEMAEPILKDIIRGSNQRDWELFSRHMPKANATDEARADVEKQWKENPVLTSLSEDCEFLGVIRKTDTVLVLWKQTSATDSEEYLEQLYLQEIDGEVKAIGTWVE